MNKIFLLFGLTILFLSSNSYSSEDVKNYLIKGDSYYAQSDYTQALSWYRKAADQGDLHAQTMIGSIYYLGQGVSKDYKKAFFWSRKAAMQGHGEAQYNLGVMYAYGHGVPKDIKRAQRWIKSAIDNNFEKASELWGKLELWKY